MHTGRRGEAAAADCWDRSGDQRRRWKAESEARPFAPEVEILNSELGQEQNFPVLLCAWLRDCGRILVFTVMVRVENGGN